MADLYLDTLPSEIINQIVSQVEPQDLLSLRQCCTRLRDETEPLTAYSFFSHRCVILEPASLICLCLIAEHPVFGKSVQTLDISTLCLPSFADIKAGHKDLVKIYGHKKRDSDASLNKEADGNVTAYEECHSAQKALMESGDAERYLARALQRLTNCTTLRIVDLNKYEKPWPWGFNKLKKRIGFTFPSLEKPQLDGQPLLRTEWVFAQPLTEFFFNHQHIFMTQHLRFGPELVSTVVHTALDAVCESKMPLRELLVVSRAIRHSALVPPLESCWPSHRFVNLRTLNLKFSTQSVAHDPALGTAQLIGACPRLTSLAIDFPARPTSPAPLQGLMDALTIPSLRSLDIKNAKFETADDLARFFLGHRETLQSIVLNAIEIEIDSDTIVWSSLVRVIRDDTSVTRLWLTFRHHAWDIMGPYEAVDKEGMTRAISEMARDESDLDMI